ncbi:hypothetical protein ASPTUDRAFT_39528 [Aspergillus tubingensis CBS 134.48]|uniref:Uncharacterized protein n=1 Tax=Aspergillus tubingensis (strain CBS 134.48) TaxID=767770 RepID=A0A1L9NBH2_ASPTC|nr:hypothetical protein ASPTUDRAFT_39528 [Aspergillus tubingensis CBS 134.48]
MKYSVEAPAFASSRRRYGDQCSLISCIAVFLWAATPPASPTMNGSPQLLQAARFAGSNQKAMCVARHTSSLSTNSSRRFC